jgi:hypothetical protein
MALAKSSYNTAMPYNFTHALVGLTALQTHNKATSDLIKANLGAFLMAPWA